MSGRGARARPAIPALAGIGIAILLAVFATEARPAAAATLPITSPGVYDGRGATLNANCSDDFNVSIEANNVTLRNYTLLNAAESAITIGENSNIVIENVTIRGFNCAGAEGQYRAGVACWYCTALTVRNSHIETAQTYGDGIWVKNNGPNNGGGHTFTGNTISGGFDGIGGEPEDQAYGGVYRNTLIEGNSVGGCNDDGIQVEGGNANVRVRGNTITNCGIGVALAPTITGPLYIEGNVIKNLKVGIYGQQAAFKMGDGGAGAAYITGNTISTAGDGYKQTNGGLNPIISRNNCVVVGRYVIEAGDAFPAGTSFDNDTFWTSDDENAGRFIKWAGERYPDLASFKAATAQEPNGTQAQCTTPPAGRPSPPPEPEPEPTNPPAQSGSGGGASDQVSNSFVSPSGSTDATPAAPPAESHRIPTEPADIPDRSLRVERSAEHPADGTVGPQADALRAGELGWNELMPLGLTVSLLGLHVLRRWRKRLASAQLRR